MFSKLVIWEKRSIEMFGQEFHHSEHTDPLSTYKYTNNKLTTLSSKPMYCFKNTQKIFRFLELFVILVKIFTNLKIYSLKLVIGNTSGYFHRTYLISKKDLLRHFHRKARVWSDWVNTYFKIIIKCVEIDCNCDDFKIGWRPDQMICSNAGPL